MDFLAVDILLTAVDFPHSHALKLRQNANVDESRVHRVLQQRKTLP
jgi:hypothetical protein